MSEQPLDFRRFLQIVRRNLTFIGIAAALGLLVGAGYAELYPPMHESTAVVVLPSSTNNTPAEMVVASSNPVLADALSGVRPAMSLQALRRRVQVTSLTPDVILITAQGETDAQAEGTANAVANSYVAYIGSANAPVGPVPAQVLVKAANATAPRLLIRMLATTVLGTLLGAIIGVVGVLAIRRNDRQLRRRDEIADAIGVPVLASIPVRHPTSAAGWTRLLEDYKPSPADAWRLRSALTDLKLAKILGDDGSAASSVTVLSLSSDQRALALGPQLAAFAASLGIPTQLVLDPHQDTKAAATLRAAAIAQQSSGRSSRLRLTIDDSGNLDRYPDAMLRVVAVVVNGGTPRAAYARTSATLLGVSAGAATATQLARVAASAAADNRYIVGILVADPDPADATTGRVPQLARPTRTTMPTRLAGTVW
jgi:capsular polysaccharide biosynthesis protein